MSLRQGLLLMLVLAAAGWTGCGGSGDAPQLAALESDPLLEWVPEGGREVVRSSTPESDGGLLGKPRAARAEHLYALARTEDAVSDAVRTAERNGWRVDSRDATVAVLSKRLRSGRAGATITLLADSAGLPDGVRPPVLSVTLVHH